jgi:ABC-2 type transport system ATP-binding protein
VDAGGLTDSLRAAGLTVSADGAALTVAGATAEQVGRIAAAGGHVLTDLRPADRGLEDLFFQLTA